MKTLVAALLLLGAGCASPEVPPPQHEKPSVRTLGLSPRYVKYIDCDGLPIVATSQASDFALAEANYLVRHMLAHRSDVLRSLVDQHIHVSIMAVTEMTTDLPEWENEEPKAYWNLRARGVGASPKTPAVSAGEENLLNIAGDPYAGENIFLHEFAHTVHTVAMRALDPSFDARLDAAFEHARAKGLWRGTYAGTHRNEYWAEGTQSWFAANRPTIPEPTEPLTRGDLLIYDPELAALLAEVYGEHAWRYHSIATRPADERAHLAGYDATRAPPFVWPARATMPSLVWQKVDALPRASQGSAKSWVWIINRAPVPIDLHWLDAHGREDPRGSIASGGERLVETFAGHIFVVHARGQAVAGFVATETPSKIVAQ